MKILFCWQGMDGRYGQWQDGLYAAMKLLEKEHEVRYADFPLTGIEKFNPDVVLYWEAPVTQYGKDSHNWNAVCALPYKKCLLFAGGPLKAMDVKDFDLVFVESKVNEEDCERQGIPYRRAFGTNTDIFKPDQYTKIYNGFMQATFADWKRHDLFARALREDGLVAGRKQEHDMNGYLACEKNGVKILPEQLPQTVAMLINKSHTVVNTSSEMGGGQRCTLEAMACGVPVIVMSDSPKNREFVEESRAGIVCEPNEADIRQAISQCKQSRYEMGIKGIRYIYNNWTEYHYAIALIQGIKSIL